MPDESPTPDELASALLDQEAAPPAHVDPAVAARVEQFGAVAAQVGAPVPVDPDRREQAIAAALAEFDASRTAEISAAAAPAAPTPLRPRRPIALRLLGAAAAVVVVLGAVTLLRRDETNSTETAARGAATTAQGEGGGSDRLSSTNDAGGDAATAAESAPTSQAAALEGAAPEAANDAAATPPPIPTSAARDLGDLDSAAALLSQFDRFAESATPSSVCEPEARAASPLALGALLDSATLRWQDRPARALAFATTAPSGIVIIVMSDPSCEVLGQIS